MGFRCSAWSQIVTPREICGGFACGNIKQTILSISRWLSIYLVTWRHVWFAFFSTAWCDCFCFLTFNIQHWNRIGPSNYPQIFVEPPCLLQAGSCWFQMSVMCACCSSSRTTRAGAHCRVTRGMFYVYALGTHRYVELYYGWLLSTNWHSTRSCLAERMQLWSSGMWKQAPVSAP